MSFPKYDRETLLSFMINTLRNRLDVNPTPGTFWYKIADSLAEVVASQSGHQQFIADQILPETAEGEFLERHARLRGLTRKTMNPAEGTARIELIAKAQ